jgi:hypothetical protein
MATIVHRICYKKCQNVVKPVHCWSLVLD